MSTCTCKNIIEPGELAIFRTNYDCPIHGIKEVKVTGKEIIEEFEEGVKGIDPELMNKVQVLSANAQMKMFDLHARAIACHSECMGMNAENAIACNAGTAPPYPDRDFYSVMAKWGILDDKGNPII